MKERLVPKVIYHHDDGTTDVVAADAGSNVMRAAVQNGVAAVAGRSEAQQHLGIRFRIDVLRVQVGDGRKAAERGRATVVQPIPREERLRGFGIGSKHGVISLEYLGQVEPRQHSGDLVTVQAQPVRPYLVNPRLLE